MRRFGMKAFFALFTLGRRDRGRTDWDRNILILSTVVTAALIALYFWGKATSRW